MTLDDNDYFFGMSKKEIEDYINSEKKMEEDRINQYHNDVQIIRKLKKEIPKKLFHYIALSLHESEHWTKLEIVDTPTGKYQQETKKFGVWVDQYVGYCGDDFSGYCYVQLPNKEYLKWEYWC